MDFIYLIIILILLCIIIYVCYLIKTSISNLKERNEDNNKLLTDINITLLDMNSTIYNTNKINQINKDIKKSSNENTFNGHLYQSDTIYKEYNEHDDKETSLKKKNEMIKNKI